MASTHAGLRDPSAAASRLTVLGLGGSPLAGPLGGGGDHHQHLQPSPLLPASLGSPPPGAAPRVTAAAVVAASTKSSGVAHLTPLTAGGLASVVGGGWRAATAGATAGPSQGVGADAASKAASSSSPAVDAGRGEDERSGT